MPKYPFKQWSDGETSNPRQINLITDMTLTSMYEQEVNGLTTMTFTGSVSAQAAPGEEVTITVTLPDTSTDQFTAITQGDLTFSATRDYTPGTGYSAVAEVAQDAQYQGAVSSPVPFDVGLAPRTINLVVS